MTRDCPRDPNYRFVSASMLAAFCLLTLASGVAFGQTSKAYYVEARDGVRLAVDVNLPRDAVDGVRCPALLEFTRYGRSREDSRTGPRCSPWEAWISSSFRTATLS